MPLIPSPAPVSLVVEPGGEARAGSLCTRFSLAPIATQPGIQLIVKADGLWLRDSRDPKRKPLQPSYSLSALRVTRREPLARALGRKVRTVVDATAGLGGDALRLAGLGCTVIALERSPWIAALLDDTLQRLRAGTGPLAGMAGRITLIHTDARQYLARPGDRPDAVYLDPMFPVKRRKSAAVRKELLWLRELAGDDLDAEALLTAALATARERVIVKRPDHAPPLGPEPTVSYAGKLIRYDVYRTDLQRTTPRE